MIDPQENDKVAGLLGGLKRVNAPQNFESRVRSRIVEGEQPQTSWLPAFLKIAVPAAGLATIAIVLYFAGIFSRGVEEMNAEDVKAPVQKQDQQLAKDVPLPPTNLNAVAPQQRVVPQNNSIAQANTNVDRSPFRNEQKASNSNGGSIDAPMPGSEDRTMTPAKPDKMPPGFQTVPKAVDPKMAPTRAGVPATEFLRYAGVVTEARGGELYVTSVGQNSPAEKWGVKAGDTIEALNNSSVKASSTFPSGIDLRAIRVRRNGSVVNLNTRSN